MRPLSSGGLKSLQILYKSQHFWVATGPRNTL